MSTDLTEPQAPPAPPAAVPEGWEGILDPGERILWQGTPDAAVDWRALVDFRTFFGLFFAGFAAFWMLMAGAMGGGGAIGLIFPLFGVPFLIVGLNLAFGRIFWDARARAKTHYTLTDRHAFIATESWGKRKLDRFPLDRDTPLIFEDGPPGSVFFGETVIRHSGYVSGAGKNRRRRGPWTERRRHGFERIEDARSVYALLREAKAKLPATEPDPS